MIMRPRAVLVIIFLITVVILGCWLWVSVHDGAYRAKFTHPAATPAMSSQSAENDRTYQPAETPTPFQHNQNRARAFLTAFLKPIAFWGKVIDHQGNAVPGALVEWSANNNPNPHGSGTKGRTISAADGTFVVTSHGIGLYVEVSKEGHARLPTRIRGARGSYASFSNAVNLGNTEMPMGTKSEPALLVLRKKGETARLIHVSDRPVKLPKDGVPVEYDLQSGQTYSDRRGDLRIECWTHDQRKDDEGRYAWSCRVSVPGGGLVVREGDFAFDAPAEGYQSHDVITPPQERWSSTAERSYFVKTATGHFARVNVRIRTGGEHFAVVESFFNPQSGSRALEFDRDMQVSVP